MDKEIPYVYDVIVRGLPKNLNCAVLQCLVIHSEELENPEGFEELHAWDEA